MVRRYVPSNHPLRQPIVGLCVCELFPELAPSIMTGVLPFMYDAPDYSGQDKCSQVFRAAQLNHRPYVLRFLGRGGFSMKTKRILWLAMLTILFAFLADSCSAQALGVRMQQLGQSYADAGWFMGSLLVGQNGKVVLS